MIQGQDSKEKSPYHVSIASKHAKLTVPVDGKSLADAYVRRVDISRHDRVFMVKRNGAYTPISWHEVHQGVLGLFQSMRKQGIKKGDKVCILSQSCPEWIVADLAILCSGAVTVPIYQSNTVDDVAYILENCDAKMVFAEDEAQCQKLAQAFEQLKRSIPIVSFKEFSHSIDGVTLHFYEQFSSGASEKVEKELRQTVAGIPPEAEASIVYTSGTTGKPKGAVMLHSCFTSELRAIVNQIQLGKDDITLTFLPFAHILGRVESLFPIFSGITLGFAESINAVALNMSELRPTLLVSVPRIYEKVYTKILTGVESQPERRKKIFKWAVSVGRQVARLQAEKKPLPISLALKYRIADQLVLHRVREGLGGRLKVTISGGAPLAPDLCEFFHACGVKILEGYGLTETTAAVTVNHPHEYCFSSVGKPIPGAELKIAEDGEILTRGPMIFKEYYKNPESTKEAFTSGGWFRTGDIGEINERGFLKITDRKKELIVTSSGKNIAPQKLENLLKGSRLISNAMVYGDKQKYLSVLLTLNEPEVVQWAKAKGISFTRFDDLVNSPEVLELIEGEVHAVNERLASFETIKKFKILAQDFTIETGELTPSLKVKRKVVIEKYGAYLKEMYA